MHTTLQRWVLCWDHYVATETPIMDFAECYQDLNIFCREKLLLSKTPKIIRIRLVFAKLQSIEVSPNSVNFLYKVRYHFFDLFCDLESVIEHFHVLSVGDWS